MSPDELYWRDLCRAVDLQPDEVGLVCVVGIGDTYLTSALAQQLAERLRCAPVVITTPSHAQVARLFPRGVRRVVPIEHIDTRIIQQHQSLSVGHYYLAHPVFSEVSFMDKLGHDGYTLVDMHGEFLRARGPWRLERPIVECSARLEAERRFRRLGLPMSRTVLLSPATSSSPQMDFPWEILTTRLHDLGWCVCNNRLGNSRAIQGALDVEIPLREVIPFLDLSGWLVAIRSGFCDLAASSNCLMSVMYPPSQRPGGSDLSWASIAGMGLRDIVHEYEAGPETSLNELVESIVDCRGAA